MRFVQQLKYDMHRMREHFGKMPYMQVATFDVAYSVTVRNTHEHAQTVRVLLPLPLETEYQEMRKEVSFHHAPTSKNVDAEYGNHYDVWSVKIEPHDAKTLGESFSVRVYPRLPSHELSSSLNDYRNLPDVEVEPFLKPDRYIDGTSADVRRMAADILRGEKDVQTAAIMLYEHVRDTLTYGDPIPGLYSCEDALTNDKVDCGGFDALLGSLYNAVGIPARIVSGFWAGYPVNEMHAWLELLTPLSEWIPVDPSMGNLRAAGRTRKSGKFGFVGSDRIAMSIGSDIPVRLDNEEMRLPILQTPVVLAEHGDASVEVTHAFVTKRHE